MKLISCSLYNSWDTLKKEGSGHLGEIKTKTCQLCQLGQVLPGHYKLERMALEIDGLFAKYDYKLETEINQPLGQLVIKNFGLRPIELDRDLARLLGIGRKLQFMTFVKRLTASNDIFYSLRFDRQTERICSMAKGQMY